ncbi:MAG: ABC transporter substrate-binding protein [Microbacteriaceae bacterium]
MARSRPIACSVLAVGAALALSSCTGLDPQPTPAPSVSYEATGDGVLRIGTLFGLTGSTAGTGAAQVAAVDLAVREINSAGGFGGVPVEVFNRNSGDDASADPAALALTSLAELIDKGVDVVIGPSSTAVAAAIAPAAAEAGIALILTSAARPTDVAADATVVSIAPDPSLQAPALAAALAKSGARTVAVVHPEGDAVAGELATAAAAQGLTVVDVAPMAPAQSDVSALVAAVRGAGVDAVVLSVAATDAGTIVPALVAAGQAPDTLWFAADATVSYAKTLKPGLLTGSHGLFAGAPVTATMLAQLRQIDPGIGSPRFAAEAFDATVLAALSAMAAGDDGGASIGRGLRAVSSGGIPCTSFGACSDALGSCDDINYEGTSSLLDLGEVGSAASDAFAIAMYSAKNIAALAP